MPGRKRKEKAEEIGFLTTLSVPSEGSVGLTGTWRTFRPVLERERCNKCLLCWIYCPEGCITKDLEINYDYCKGCGVCAEECPTRAMSMEKEDETVRAKGREK